MSFTSIISNITWDLSQACSKISKPEPIINDADVASIRLLIKDGDAICSRVEWEFSNLAEKILTGSFWGHTAIYLDGFIYEATTKGVRKITLEMFCYRKDALGLGRLQGSDWTPEQCAKMKTFLEAQIGAGYDFSFSWGLLKKWYCSKLVYFAWNQANAIETNAIQSMSTFGLKKVTPQNIWDSIIQLLKCGSAK